jgi:hypothetical protein
MVEAPAVLRLGVGDVIVISLYYHRGRQRKGKAELAAV